MIVSDSFYPIWKTRLLKMTDLQLYIWYPAQIVTTEKWGCIYPPDIKQYKDAVHKAEMEKSAVAKYMSGIYNILQTGVMSSGSSQHSEKD